MNKKDKLQLFQRYLEEEFTIKYALENKSNIVLTLLVVLITWVLLNINDIANLVQPSIKPYLLILLLIKLGAIVFYFYSAIKVLSNKAFRKSIPDKYFELLLLENNKDRDEIIDDLVIDLNTKIEANSKLNYTKSIWLNRAQKTLAFVYI